MAEGPIGSFGNLRESSFAVLVEAAMLIRPNPNWHCHGSRLKLLLIQVLASEW